MTTQLDEAIDAYVGSLDIESWAPLTSTERDLVRRTLGRTKTTDTHPVPVAA